MKGTRRALLVIAAVALAHALVYVYLQRGDWDSATAWTDQRGYQRLGAVLATTGQFTRYADADVFVPEVIRTPGYPAFVAVVYRLFGVGNNLAVAVAQALVFVAICLMVVALARRVADDRTAILAGVMTALYPPLPYFGGLIVTELWTAFVATAAMVVAVRAAQQGRLRDFTAAGVLFSAATLVRPAFVLMPFFFALAVPVLVRSQRARWKGWAVLAIAAGLTLAPWLVYNYVNLGQLTLSPAGGLGRGLWEGSWQGRWPGRMQAELISLADATSDRTELDRRVRDMARDTGYPAGPMLQYVTEWRDIRAVWDTPTDPAERVRARVLADQEYLRHAVANITADPIGHLTRRLTRGAFVLWAAEVPIPYDRINTTPTPVVRAIWILQLLLLAVAAGGAVRLARSDRWLEAVMLALPLVYVTGVHLPLLCEARQSLPVKPIVLALAAIGLTSRRNASS